MSTDDLREMAEDVLALDKIANVHSLSYESGQAEMADAAPALARGYLDAAKALQEAQERAECGLCGGPYMVRNPHPDAGKPSRVLEVGAMWECIPCTVRTRHGWAERAQAAEERVRVLEEFVRAEAAEGQRDALMALQEARERIRALEAGGITEPEALAFAKSIAADCGLRIDALLGPSRRRDVCEARWMFWKALYDNGWSMTKIARLSGRRSHTTIMRGIAQVAQGGKE